MRKTLIVSLDLVVASIFRHYGERDAMAIIGSPSSREIKDRVRNAFRLNIPVRTIMRRDKKVDFEFKFASIDDAVWFRLKWL